MTRMIALLLVLGVPAVGFAQLPKQLVTEQLQRAWVQSGQQVADIEALQLQSMHTSRISGITHAYFQQSYGGIPIRDGVGSIHLDQDGQMQHINLQFYTKLAEKIKTTTARLSPQKAKQLVQSTTRSNNAPIDRLSQNQSQQPIPEPVLEYVEDEAGELKLAYRLAYSSLPDNDDRPLIWIDADSGREIDRQNRTLHCHFGPEEVLPAEQHAGTVTGQSADQAFIINTAGGAFTYYAFPFQIESPAFGRRALLPAATIVNDLASPLGWHQNTATSPSLGYTQGNNVYAFYAPLGQENPAPAPIVRDPLTDTYLTGNVPWPANGKFDYRRSLDQLVAGNFIEDAVTNLFVRNNFLHDLLFHYGFDEAAGNFQTTNLTGAGQGNDHVLARAQDGLGVNQASFFTPPDGENPQMRMFLWNTDLPNSARDGSFDNLIIAHEYAHGLSFRLIGGAANTNCLTNFEQGGEGWSDYLGLMMTLTDRNGDGQVDQRTLGEGVRGIGHYVLSEAETESGLRPRHYTTNMDCGETLCNEFTYADLELLAPPHGVGFLWCTMLWDMTWQLIDTYGFEADLFRTDSQAGNIRALKIVIEALKMTPCRPSFIDMRDAVLAANEALYGGEGQDRLWAAFARRGLGYSAAASGVAAFDDPYMRLIKTVDKTSAEIGEAVTFTLSLTNHTDQPLRQTVVSDQLPEHFTVTHISDGGSQSADGLVSWPHTTIPKRRTINRTITGYLDETVAPTTVLATYPVEVDDLSGFVPAGGWIPSGDYPNPNGNSTASWFHLNAPTATESSLVLSLDLPPGKNHHLSFWQAFDLEPALDAGVVEVLAGGVWKDLGPQMIKNGYNSLVLDELPTPVGRPVPFTSLSRRRAFSGFSGGYRETIIDLSAYEGPIQIRFRFASNLNTNVNACDGSTPGCDGWFIDDVRLLDLQHLPNLACAGSPKSIFYACGDIGPLGTVFYPVAENAIRQLPGRTESDHTATRQIRTFPNPATTRMTVQFTSDLASAPERISLLNLQGQILDSFHIPAGENSIEIDGSRLPRGLYLLSIQGAEENTIHRIAFQ